MGALFQPTYRGEVSGRDSSADHRPEPPSLSRRGLLGLGLGLTAAATGLAGCSTDGSVLPDLPSVPRERASCVARSSLPRYDRLAGLPLVYEVNRRRSEFAIDEGFAGQLEAWLTDLRELTGWPLQQVRTYGTWTNGGSACSSWHNAGRAFDLARLRREDGTDVSCRYDLWRDSSGGDLTEARRTYWTVAASAHRHFAYVLTYRYNAQHHNHIHLDNGRSGTEPSTFSSRSPAQVQAVQGILTHLWDAPVEVTGRWDAATRDVTESVLGDLAVGDDLADQATWAGFLTASVRRGAEPA
jgi:hypothetical protein